MTLNVKLMSWPTFDAVAAFETHGWDTDGEPVEQLAEFAGRACYQSWDKPNPKTATNAGYLDNIIEVGHYSVLEHGHFTFYIRGVSRSLTHELVRHRHLSPSQLSQRFVVLGDMDPIIPPLYRGQPGPEEILSQAWERAGQDYEALIAWGAASGHPKKQVREAARAVLPNMTPTAIVMSGNMRSWREFILKRNTLAADAEIRELAQEILRQLREAAPNMVADL